MTLKQKLLTIMVIGLTVMAGMSFVTVQILSSSYNKMLYQTMSESMSYSAKDITDYMDKMENLTEIFLSDEKVQKELTVLKNGEERNQTALAALNKLGVSVGIYYQNYSDGILKYISLYTPISVLKTNLIAADKIPMEAQSSILLEADEKDGAPCWITDYMNEYGLFLARNVRQIEALKLDNLGTILLNIDMNALVESSTGFEEQYGETAYVILSQGKLLFHTQNLEPEDVAAPGWKQIDHYGIENIGENRYFISHGEIPEYGWDYFCLVSYDKIDRQLRGIQSISLWIIILDFIVIIYLTTVLIGRLVVHISSLRDRMQQFAQDNTQVPETGYDYSRRKDELGVLNQQFNEMSNTIIRLIQDNYVNELLKKEAQIKALENQINPHFLYNTLDSIKWRARAIGDNDISDMVEALGILLRTSLRNRDEEHYTVGKEMEIVESYITIQRFRYEERLLFENHIRPDWNKYIIPKMMIQPLLENAIFYGLEQNVEECHIILSGVRREEALCFYVKNTGSEMPDNLLEKLGREEVKPHGHGVGLLNIDKRLKIQYGGQYGLRLYNETDYAVAELMLPIAEEGEGC